MTTDLKDRTVDLSFVDKPARIAVYDDLLSSPRVIEIMPNNTRDFIGDLSSKVYEAAKFAGGQIPYTVISQVAENFIHSYFTEVVVSVLDNGNTIRFSDQGPGIPDKQKALTPGFSTATAQMKEVIHGVGSGLPIVSEYMKSKSGKITLEDNMTTGAVVTISLNDLGTDLPTSTEERSYTDEDSQDDQFGMRFPSQSQGSKTKNGSKENIPHSRIILAQISQRQQSILRMFKYENVLSVTEISTELGIASSSAHYDLQKLEELGIVTKLGKKRVLTEFGLDVLQDII